MSTNKNKIVIVLPKKLFSFEQLRRWGIVPERIILLRTKRKWRPYYSKSEWRDHLMLRQRRGWFIGRLYVGVEGIPFRSIQS